MKGITADQARKFSDSISSLALEKELQQIESAIELAARAGRTSMSPERIGTQVKTELEKRGFKVKTEYDPREGSWIIISW